MIVGDSARRNLASRTCGCAVRCAVAVLCACLCLPGPACAVPWPLGVLGRPHAHMHLCCAVQGGAGRAWPRAGLGRMRGDWGESEVCAGLCRTGPPPSHACTQGRAEVWDDGGPRAGLARAQVRQDCIPGWCGAAQSQACPVAGPGCMRAGCDSAHGAGGAGVRDTRDPVRGIAAPCTACTQMDSLAWRGLV